MSRIALIVVCLLLAFSGTVGAQQVLVQAEPLTESEITKLAEAHAAVAKAMKQVQAVEDEIFEAHKMHSEHYMEWETTAQIDGKFILLYHTNFMANFAVAVP